MAQVLLIVEDYQNQRDIYHNVLTMEGYKVDLAEDGEQALQKAGGAQYDVILLDLLLPKMDGISFLKAYDLKKHPNTKVIVFSNISNPELVKQAMDLGVAKFLAKSSVTPKAMVTAIKEVLGS